MEQSSKYMERAIQLAKLGMGRVAPNPMVGSVIVHNGTIIGEGYHQKYGEAHAEVNAINSVMDKSLLKESTIYVTLEPCSHYGKTPPCCDLIIENQIPRVVIGTIDPFAKVAGRGIQKMRDAGIEVVMDVLNNDCVRLNRRFFTFHKKQRPYIILKWAQTLDGFIDIDRSAEAYGQPTWITNTLSKTAVHKMRANECAIMVGTDTAQKDNPSLSARNWYGKHPLRIVLDRSLRLSDDLTLKDGNIPTLVYTQKERSGGDNLDYVSIDFEGDILEQILTDLHKRDVQSLIVEGGKTLLTSFIDANLWDEARIFWGKKLFGAGIPAPVINYPLVKEDQLDSSKLLVIENKNPV